MGGSMAGLIEYATNCTCGQQINVHADVDKQQLDVTVQVATLPPVRQRAQLPRRGPGRPPKAGAAGEGPV